MLNCCVRREVTQSIQGLKFCGVGDDDDASGIAVDDGISDPGRVDVYLTPAIKVTSDT
jgi:hypothetical protein